MVNPRTVILAGVVLGSLTLAQAANAAPTTVGGGAFALQANVNALIIPANAGPLPAVTLPSSGSAPLTASLLNTNVLGLATVKTANVSTAGTADPGTADSSATVADVDVLGLVKAKVASSTCSATTGTATGSAKVTDLVVAGLPIAVVNLGPNTTISTPVGTITINEQVTAPTAPVAAARASARTSRATSLATTAQSITVNAVHVHLNVLGLVTGDVILAQSRCSVG